MVNDFDEAQFENNSTEGNHLVNKNVGNDV